MPALRRRGWIPVLRPKMRQCKNVRAVSLCETALGSPLCFPGHAAVPISIASWQDGAMFRNMTLRAVVLPLLCLMGSLSAQAQSWPMRPVRIVVPFSGAGTADLLTRIVADKLGAALGQPFVVEDRPGAGGIIGQESVMRSAPDGYTLVVSSLGSLVI